MGDSKTSNTLEAIVKLVPVLILIVDRMVELVRTARDEGYQVPSLNELRNIQNLLREYEDLSDEG